MGRATRAGPNGTLVSAKSANQLNYVGGTIIDLATALADGGTGIIGVC